MQDLVNTVWAAKDGSRTVRVVVYCGQFRGDADYLVRNQTSGRNSHISGSGLRSKFTQLPD